MSEPRPAKRPVDHRPRALFVSLLAILSLGALVILLPDYKPALELSEPESADAGLRLSPQEQRLKAQLDKAYAEGVALLHAKAYDGALIAFNRVVHIAPRMPEAYVNMGFALIGLERYEQAARAFDYATELRPEQINAYYGLALVFEHQGNLRAAREAMQTYVHRSPANDPYLPKARAALWEWQQALNSEGAGSESVEQPSSKNGREG